MGFAPAYQPLYDVLLDFIARPEFRDELVAGRQEYVRQTGETFEEDRSYEPRMQAFLDWFIFDRPLAPLGDAPVRAFLQQTDLPLEEAQKFRNLGRTVHGLFDVIRHKDDVVQIRNVLTETSYEAARDKFVAGLHRRDLFEGRLVPYEGAYHFSSAFLFLPSQILPRVRRELKRQRRAGEVSPVDELLFTLSRMAGRAEHYRNVGLDAIYDFARPPPKIAASPLRFDAESVAQRLGRLPLPAGRDATAR